MITRPVGGADAAPPVRNYESLREIREEEWLSLIDAAVKWTDYRFLVLDLESLQGLTQILKKCDLIYVLQQEQDLFSEPKMEEFEQALRERDCQELLLRTRVWKVPPGTGEEGCTGVTKRYGRPYMNGFCPELIIPLSWPTRKFCV